MAAEGIVAAAQELTALVGELKERAARRGSSVTGSQQGGRDGSSAVGGEGSADIGVAGGAGAGAGR